MKKEDLRIVYLGTPDFAVESLKRLVEGGYHVVGVVTTPDKHLGRHRDQLTPSPVKEYALEQGLPLLQPEKLKDETFLAQLQMLHADLQIVVAFRMLPEVVWAMPRLGTFNLHASLLPQYRGAAPINWAIMNGEKETGITTFFIEKDIDTGEIIDQVHVPIAETDTFEDVHDRLMQLGGDLVIKTVDNMLAGCIQSHPQNISAGSNLKPAPKIFRETCRIDWSRSVEEIYNFVRGLCPMPAAWTMLEGGKQPEVMKIFKTEKISESHSYEIGTVITDERTFLKVALRDGFLNISEMQLAGKKRMTTEEFLRGYKCPESMKVE